jgi:hypothetical protein
MGYWRLFVISKMLLIFAGCATISGWLGIPYGAPEFASSIPARPSSASTGSQIVAKLSSASLAQREEIILSEAKSGNIPNFIRNMQPVQIKGRRRNGTPILATIWVSPDYFALGSDLNFVRIPMTPMTAQRICDAFGFVVPTRKIVDEIYRNAALRLSPSPMKPGNQMSSLAYYQQHNSTIDRQLGSKRASNRLIAGHKKDIVNTNILARRPLQVAIYGWHRGIGSPIQPLSLVHINSYADYSHGLRLIRDVMVVDGKKMLVRKLMQDPELSSLLSDEGPVYNHRLPTKAHPSLMGKSNS